MSLITKEQILQAQDLDDITVEVPEWGGEVRLKEMTGTQRDRYERQVAKQRIGDSDIDMSGLKAALVAMCLVGEDDVQIFTRKEAEELSKKSGAVINTLFTAARKLNKMSDQDLEDEEGNSKGEPSDSNGSDSPSSSTVPFPKPNSA